MAIGNEADTPSFGDQAFRNNNGKTKTLASSGCSIIQFDHPFPFNPSSTPLSGDKGKPGQLTKRHGCTIQPALKSELPQHYVGDLSCMSHRPRPRFYRPTIFEVVTPRKHLFRRFNANLMRTNRTHPTRSRFGPELKNVWPLRPAIIDHGL